jgi:hypothetical protein
LQGNTQQSDTKITTVVHAKPNAALDKHAATNGNPLSADALMTSKNWTGFKKRKSSKADGAISLLFSTSSLQLDVLLDATV